MEAFVRTTADDTAALDFTSCARRNRSPRLEPAEPPVLDLSCKRDACRAPIASPASVESCESSYDARRRTPSRAESERKSPFEGRTFMVTPPSESDSPKKIKYEPIYQSGCPASSDATLGQPQHGHLATIPIAIPLPTMPALFAQSGPMRLPVAPVMTTPTGAGYASDVAPASPASPEVGKKAPRPFKAYPKDPLSLAVGTTDMYEQNAGESYSEFRKRMLESVRKTNEGTNIKMRRVTKSPGLPTSTMDEKDAAYWERRRKNNEAAKRSRDARRAKEDEIAIRAAFLEQENMKLKYELVALRNETAKLRCMVYST